jgi:hypothetical protein
MSGYYGQADAGSVLQNAPSYGAAAAGLMPAPATPAAPGARTFVENRWKASFRPELAGGVGDFGYQKADGSWAAIPQDVRNANTAEFGAPTLQARRAKLQEEQNEIKNRGISDNARQDRRDELDLRIRGLDEQVRQNTQTNNLALETLRQQGETNTAQIALQGQRLSAETSERQADRAQQGEQHKDAMTIRNDELRMSREQMQLNNQLQDRKLTMEDRHFQQQAALDHKNSRRTQVMNALTLIAQSAAKL